jgi:signal transduction histidine kinase/ActR/RegA family two-component response regulator
VEVFVHSLFDLAEMVPPVTPETPGSVVYDLFQSEPGLLSVAVVQEDGTPLGLIERDAFSLKMAGQYGRALYAGRPVTMVMNAEARVVDGGVALKVFTNDSLSEAPADLLRGFIVTRQGRYAGVGSALSLLQAQNSVIREQAMEARAALRAKSEFLAVMSHEIRTPLNGVLAVAEVVSRQLTQEPLRPYVETIISSGQTLLRLLNDALDLSRAEAGRLELEEAAFSVRSVVEDIDSLWRARANERGLRFTTAFDGDPALWAIGDTVRIKQVLNNLVGNALKFTSAGSVEARLAARLDDGEITVSAEVHDTGPGIAAEDIQRLFLPFNQTNAGRAAGGTGLGLSICRQLVEKMGGSLTARSEVGRGSVFAFEVRLREAVDPGLGAGAAGADEVDQGATAHVLIADDNATNRMVAETLCVMFGCTCEAVETGAEAVDLAQTGRFDLILMDIMMPVMDGLEATRRIRAAPTCAAIPIIALTANADPHDAQSYMAQGMDAVVEKPIKAETLLAAIQQALSAAEGTGGQARADAA